MSRRPLRVPARVAPRPDVRRWIFIAAAVATAAIAVASAAGAQSTPIGGEALERLPALITDAQLAAEQHAPVAEPREASQERRSFAAGPRTPVALVTYTPAGAAAHTTALAPERELRRPASRNNAALIVVGLSAMVIGSVVDDDAGSLIVLGGAGVTLYGLWQYLR